MAHQKGSSMNTTPITGNSCGTTTGYNRHRRAGEPTCQPCKKAESERTRRARLARTPGKSQEPRPTATETAEELDFLLSIGQGWGPAMHAVGYKNPSSLARQLQRAGRNDLAVIFEDQSKAAA